MKVLESKFADHSWSTSSPLPSTFSRNSPEYFEQAANEYSKTSFRSRHKDQSSTKPNHTTSRLLESRHKGQSSTKPEHTNSRLLESHLEFRLLESSPKSDHLLCRFNKVRIDSRLHEAHRLESGLREVHLKDRSSKKTEDPISLRESRRLENRLKDQSSSKQSLEVLREKIMKIESGNERLKNAINNKIEHMRDRQSREFEQVKIRKGLQRAADPFLVSIPGKERVAEMAQ